ncbi:unnamed protein product [Ixodes pacificus]
MSHFFKTTAHAAIYAKFRPVAPSALIDRIVKFVTEKASPQLAVDIGCGPGTSSGVLAPHFQQVHAYDVSEAQIEEAKANNRIANLTYGVADAEAIPEANGSAQLITASQCAHWFDLDKFYAEAERVLSPGGVLALYGYLIPVPVSKDQAKMDKLIHDELYMGCLEKHWTKQRKVIDNMYRDLRLPFDDIVRDESFEDKKVQSVADYLNYACTWSAYQAHLKENPEEAKGLIARLTSALMDIYGDGTGTPATTSMEVKIQYFLVMGRKPATGVAH